MIQILIADNDENRKQWMEYMRICNYSMNIVQTNYNSKDLLSLLEQTRPDIVLATTENGSIPMTTIISEAQEQGVKCHFILVCESPSFDILYAAIKCHVDDFFIKPISLSQFRFAIDRIVKLIQEEGSTSMMATGRHTFISTVCATRNFRFDSVNEINDTYGTKFKEGNYRALFIKLDSPDNPTVLLENQQQLNDSLELSVYQFFNRTCHDIILEKRHDGILFLINYLVFDDFEKTLTDFFSQAQKSVSRAFPDIRCTLCVGKEHHDITHPFDVKNEALDVRWMRMQLGTNRIIYWEEPESSNMSLAFEKLCQEIVLSCNLLDRKTFEKKLKTFFTLPYSILTTRDARRFVRKVIDCLLESARNNLGDSGFDYNHYKKRLDFLLNMSIDFKQFQETLTTNLLTIMDQLSFAGNKTYSQPIAQAMHFISQHYTEQITLNEVAESACLSSSYFCNLFHKETGKRYLEYLNEFRIEKAKKILMNSNKTIQAIASEVGFNDSRYFIRTFKTYQSGMTPGQFRSSSQFEEIDI